MTNAILVGIDDGYAQTKLFGDNPKGGEPIKMMVRSSVRSGRFSLSSLSGEGNIGSYKVAEGEEFTVSDIIEGESTQFDGFHTSTMNRVLVHHALVNAGYGGQKIKLIAGLPLADFFSNGKKNERKIALKKENLLKGVVSGDTDEKLAELIEVDVGCQALAAFVDYFLDDDLNEKDVPIEKIAVVDIGGRTTDIALVLDGASFDPRRSGTENIGVLDVYNSLSEMIKARFSTRDDYPVSTIDKAVRTGKIRLWGKEKDIQDLVDQAVHEQQEKIVREIERRLGSASDLDAVLFVGGGSALFKGIAKLFENGESASDPEYSNARGLYKYSKKFS
jgi:plasmid segregation protein ParM